VSDLGMDFILADQEDSIHEEFINESPEAINLQSSLKK